MKGMQKIKWGKQFVGVVFYSFKLGFYYKIMFYIIGGNMMGSIVVEFISEFEGIRLLCFGVVKFVWYNLFCLLKGEILLVR